MKYTHMSIFSIILLSFCIQEPTSSDSVKNRNLISYVMRTHEALSNTPEHKSLREILNEEITAV